MAECSLHSDYGVRSFTSGQLNQAGEWQLTTRPNLHLPHYRYSDTLVLRHGRWQVVFAQVTPLPALWERRYADLSGASGNADEITPPMAPVHHSNRAETDRHHGPGGRFGGVVSHDDRSEKRGGIGVCLVLV